MKTIEEYIKLLPNKVSSNIEIIKPSDLGQDFFLHVSPDKMSRKSYIPYISRRQGNQEDRTTPRVTVSDFLLGCIAGYATLSTDVIYQSDIDDIRGLYINEIPFECALKPNNKLVYDQSVSNEHWLVTYSEDTKEYKSKQIGKIFVTNLSIIPNQKKTVKDIVYQIYIEITKPEGIKFSKNIFLEKGYFSISGIRENQSYTDDKKLLVRVLSQSEFMEQKSISASTLELRSVNNLEPTLITKW